MGNPPRADLVIGLTGPNAAGKGEVAAYLRQLGFELHSLSDVVRKAAAALDLPPDREHLIRIGNRLRQEGGPGALAREILKELSAPAVVDSIRNPAEVEVLREALPGFFLLGVDAPEELRFRRGLARGRPGDPETLEEFRARERQENAEDPGSQRLSATFRLADSVVDNSGDPGQLREKVDRILARWKETP